jgi:hypothetical protein
MASSEVRVCPRCGSPAGESRWCSTCGLNLDQDPNWVEQQRRSQDARRIEERIRERDRKWAEQQRRHQDARRIEERIQSAKQRERDATREARRLRRIELGWKWKARTVLMVGLAIVVVSAVAEWQIESMDLPGIKDGALPVLGDETSAPTHTPKRASVSGSNEQSAPGPDQTPAAGQSPTTNGRSAGAVQRDCPDAPDIGPTGVDPADAIHLTVGGGLTCAFARQTAGSFFQAQIERGTSFGPVRVNGAICKQQTNGTTIHVHCSNPDGPGIIDFDQR